MQSFQSHARPHAELRTVDITLISAQWKRLVAWLSLWLCDCRFAVKQADVISPVRRHGTQHALHEHGNRPTPQTEKTSDDANADDSNTPSVRSDHWSCTPAEIRAEIGYMYCTNTQCWNLTSELACCWSHKAQFVCHSV
jgi:hypothetical protein